MPRAPNQLADGAQRRSIGDGRSIFRRTDCHVRPTSEDGKGCDRLSAAGPRRLGGCHGSAAFYDGETPRLREVAGRSVYERQAHYVAFSDESPAASGRIVVRKKLTTVATPANTQPSPIARAGLRASESPKHVAARAAPVV